MNPGGIPQNQLDDLNRTFNGFGLESPDTYDKPQKIIFDSEKVRELKAREDYYYKEIQKAIEKLDKIKKARDEASILDLRKNYQEYEFLHGIDGKQSLKQKWESELLQL